jgi:hypothetical protein
LEKQVMLFAGSLPYTCRVGLTTLNPPFATGGFSRPDNLVIDFNYSSGGELAEIVLPNGTQTFGYDAVTRQLATVT